MHSPRYVVVEDVTKQRQPLPELDAIYFLSPDLSSVELLCRDFQNPEHPQYRTAHVFFTLPLGNVLRGLRRFVIEPNQYCYAG